MTFSIASNPYCCCMPFSTWKYEKMKCVTVLDGSIRKPWIMTSKPIIRNVIIASQSINANANLDKSWCVYLCVVYLHRIKYKIYAHVCKTPEKNKHFLWWWFYRYLRMDSVSGFWNVKCKNAWWMDSDVGPTNLCIVRQWLELLVLVGLLGQKLIIVLNRTALHLIDK